MLRALKSVTETTMIGPCQIEQDSWCSGDEWQSQQRCVSVIIPVLNEAATISSVVEFASRSPLVDEVIVVDDGSIDGSPELAVAAGARVIMSTMLGKGASMEDGTRYAKNEWLLFLDGDLQGLAPDLVERMTLPLIAGEADFVKAKFRRAGGRVTALTARPLLRTYFPELSAFNQPLSGIMAARRSLLATLRFENDYGVDVGLFIDAARANARLAEVDVGELKHDSHPLTFLEEMATQVARTILGRAACCGRLRESYVQEVVEAERHHQATLENFLSKTGGARRVALFDMDGTLLNGRFVLELAQRTGRAEALDKYLDNAALGAELRTRAIGSLFAGLDRGIFEETARQIPLIDGAVDAVVGLRKAGFCVGIVTDSYQLVAEIVRRRVFADFALGNLMRFKRGKATGAVTLAPTMFHDNGCPEHRFCKSNVIRHVVDKLGVSPEDMLSVGDGRNDICMLRATGKSVAFQPKALETAQAAQQVLNSNLAEVLAFI
jgi:glucosyl-3-phosphoglycerate synthase